MRDEGREKREGETNEDGGRRRGVYIVLGPTQRGVFGLNGGQGKPRPVTQIPVPLTPAPPREGALDEDEDRWVGNDGSGDDEEFRGEVLQEGGEEGGGGDGWARFVARFEVPEGSVGQEF